MNRATKFYSGRYVIHREAKSKGEERTVRVASARALLATIGYKTILSAFAISKSPKLSEKLISRMRDPALLFWQRNTYLQGRICGHTCTSFLLQQEESSSNLRSEIVCLAR